jgi:dihydropteroate synthase
MREYQNPAPIEIGSHTFDFSRTYIIGVLNVTPDSFSDGGRFLDTDAALTHALSLASEGADIIDIGGESTRPGAERVHLDAELARVIPVIENFRAVSNTPISVDTYKSAVARAAVDKGADLINDISGLRFDPAMAETAASLNVPVVVMHMKGEPTSMQANPVYENLIEEIYTYFEESIGIAEKAGVPRKRILIDPGIGFGKTFPHNFSVLRNLWRFSELGLPILVGASRKSFLGSLSDTGVDDRLEESLAAAVIAASNGAHFVRVHDVVATRRALGLFDAVRAAE